MYWLIDIVAVIILLAAIWYGFNRGLVKFAGGAGVVILRVACVAATSLLFLLIFQRIGFVDALTNALAGMFGQAESFAVKSIAEKLVSWQNMLATAIALLPAIGLSLLIFWFAFRYLEKLVEKININGDLALVDKIAGIVLVVTVFNLFYAFVLAIIGCFAKYGGMLYLDEMLRACPFTGLIYKHNAFVGVIDKMGFVAKIMNYLKA